MGAPGGNRRKALATTPGPEMPTEMAATVSVSGGFFIFEQGVFDYLNDDPQLFLEYEPLQRLARGEIANLFTVAALQWLALNYTEMMSIWK